MLTVGIGVIVLEQFGNCVQHLNGNALIELLIRGLIVNIPTPFLPDLMQNSRVLPG